ncbi:MAG: hypothetical protein HY900_04010 [Deltaproteobacteria bacterium]|nr:hypothetical protein [Deltaproteobacteria bacterium]
MSEPLESEKQPEAAHAAVSYPAMRKAGRLLALLSVAFLVLYYQLDLFPMVLHSIPPLVGLLVLGSVVGLFCRKRLFLACFFTWWLILMAVILRRSSMASVPLAAQLFDGALISYPAWAVWFAQCYRLVAYFFALWYGGRLGRRLRFGRATA